MEPNAKNLERLGRYLANMPRDYERAHFYMGTFVRTKDWAMYGPVAARGVVRRADCGTVACALGHAPLALSETVEGKRFYSWGHFCEEVFGIEFNNSDFYFLFGSGWAFNLALADYDRTAYAAADRIAAYLFEPDNYRSKHMKNCYGAAKRAGWVERQKMTRKPLQRR